MSSKRSSKRLWLLALVGLGVLIIVLLLDLLVPYSSGLDLLIRGAALFGYFTIFLSILGSNYLRELVRFFGAPFIKIHHVGTIAGLVMVTVHPISVAIRAGSLGVFAPQFTTLYDFFLYGGRPAWYLLVIATVAAVLRSRWAKGWRMVHWLSYVAFLLATVHAILLGINFGGPVMRVVAITLAAVVVAVFVLKRLPKRKPARR